MAHNSLTCGYRVSHACKYRGHTCALCACKYRGHTHDNPLYCQYRIMTIIRLIHVRAER
ncbi:hypothetical protein QJV43_gp62 [Serratia phage Serbin]|uniref:Uncharacterized protein n=1 Tax=Serratia phage Serbin TaxID=2562181 RepID=A0A482MHD4_9CAUD|nr:hypothetical protein QJV43_gp62 [Serratia phage Serbin]QBQ72978.1 hypothetical protein CPT_Serbin_062 [Serratia phage Serbin]